MNLSNIVHFFNNPKVIIIILFITLILLFISEGITEGFEKQFFSFGPNVDSKGEYSTFLGIKLNSWKNVSLTYVFLLITSIMEIYFSISKNELNKIIDYSSLLNKLIPLPKLWTYLYYIFEPLFTILIYMIKFYATATLQIQYILPQLLGSYMVTIPFIIHWLRGKEFV